MSQRDALTNPLSTPLLGHLPDPGRYCLFPSRGALLERLQGALTGGRGVVVVIGESGSGKTSLLHRLAATLPTGLPMILLTASEEQPDALLGALLAALDPGQPYPAANPKYLFDALERRAAYQQRLILAVDEAHRLTAANLELLQIMVRFRGGVDNPVRLLLAGRQEITELLAEPDYRPLAEEVALTVTLPPLSLHETREYAQALLEQVADEAVTLSRGGGLMLHFLTRGRLHQINHTLRLAFSQLPPGGGGKVITFNTLRRARVLQNIPDDFRGVPKVVAGGLLATLLVTTGIFFLGRLSVPVPQPLPALPPGSSATALKVDTQLSLTTPVAKPAKPVQEPAVSRPPPTPPPREVTARTPPDANDNPFPGATHEVQAGSFGRPDNAQAVAQRLRERGYRTYVKTMIKDRHTNYSVRVSCRGRAEAEQAANVIHRLEGLPTLVISLK